MSDELCAKHNLSIIKPENEHGKSYKEWQADRNGGSGKTTMRKDINDTIRHASNYDEFLMLMRVKGYEIKGEDFGEDSAKYIAFRPLDKEHFVRGSTRSLGKEYTKERIKERIEIQLEQKAKKKVLLPKKDYSKRNLVDTSGEKFQNSSGLKRWANIENLKITAQTYQKVSSITELEQKISTLSETEKSAKQTLVKVERRMKDLAEIIKYAKQYKDTKPYQLRYKNARDKDTAFRKFESKLILHDGAKRVLEQKGLNAKSLNIDKLKAEYQELLSQKAELTASYQNNGKELKSLNRRLVNLKQYLGYEPLSQHEKEQAIDKSSHSL